METSTSVKIPGDLLLQEVTVHPQFSFLLLAGALSNLVYWKVSLPMAGGLELDDL